MNSAVKRKTMKNLRNRINVKLKSNKKDTKTKFYITKHFEQ